jgi:hypothetical protein
MADKKNKPKPGKQAPKEAKSVRRLIHPELEGFHIGINSMGQISTSAPLEDLNEFLDRHAPDRRSAQRGAAKDEASAPDQEKP